MVNIKTMGSNFSDRCIWVLLFVIMLSVSLYAADESDNSSMIEEGKRSPKIIAGPYLQHVTKTEITIMWETDRSASGKVEYGGQGNLHLDRSRTDEGQVTIHEVKIEDRFFLLPGRVQW